MNVISKLVRTCAFTITLAAADAASAAGTAAGPRIPYPDPAELSPAVRAGVAQTPINVLRMMARASEGVFTGFGQFTGAIYMGSTLNPFLREIAIIRVGHLSKAPYEVFQHEAAARLMKMSEAQIDALRQGGPHPKLFTPAQQAVMDFTDDVVKNVRAGDATLAAVRKHLNDTEVVDLIFLIGAYMTVARLLETAGVPMDAAPLDWDGASPKPK